jgi:hydrogenase/urease accessory protein HupE
MSAARTLFAVCVSLVLTGTALADIFRPAYLELRERDQDTYDVLWKVPATGDDSRLAIQIVFPDTTEQVSVPAPFVTDGAWIERWQVRHPGGLAGQFIGFTGNAASVSDIIARVERLDGSSQVERLSAGTPGFTVRPAAGAHEIAWAYTVLGVEHILGGIDHLLFVLALLLIVRGGKRIFVTITAFTVAHSITLVSASLGLVAVPGPPVEAIIALSIIFVASEVVHGLQGKAGLTARAPWIVAFSFGLLHGFGFAGALAEVGLPQVDIPIALLMFNVGVEIGQLLFVAACLLLAGVANRLFPRSLAWVSPLAAYAIGTVATFWTIERVVSFWS